MSKDEEVKSAKWCDNHGKCKCIHRGRFEYRLLKG